MTTTNPLWDIQRPYTEEALREAQRQFRQGAPAPYSGPRVAGFDPVRAAGINRALQAAAGPQQQLADIYTGQISDIAQGTDPGTQRLARQASAAVTPAVSGAGLLGSTYGASAAHKAATDTILGRQFDALSHIPRAQTAAITPARTFTEAGKTQQDYQQDLIDAAQQQYSEQVAAPQAHLKRYTDALGVPGVSAPTQTPQPSAPSVGSQITSGLQDAAVNALVSGLGGAITSGIGSFFAEGGEVGMPSPRYQKAKMRKMNQGG